MAACARRGYELLAPIGHGGMGCVWLALDRNGGEVVAIKAMLPKVADDLEFRAMFLDEGRIASRIDNPHVARVLALEDGEGVLFQVMEWVDGESLLDLHRAASRRGERIPIRVVLQALSDACDGLHAAHELRGGDGEPLLVVHRDVSPANVLASASGDVKLVDFGIAKARARTAQSTIGFALKGRVHYVAPEYALGYPTDRRADTWSMGATLYFLLCGREPFAASNETAVLYKLTSGEPLPRLPAHVPGDVAAIAYRALERDPRDRFATAAQMRDALADAASRTGRDPARASVARFVAEHESTDLRARRRIAQVARGKGGEAPVALSRPARRSILIAAIGVATAAIAIAAWWPSVTLQAARSGSGSVSTLARGATKSVVPGLDTLVVELPPPPRRAPPREVPPSNIEPRTPTEPRVTLASPPAVAHPARASQRRHYGF